MTHWRRDHIDRPRLARAVERQQAHDHTEGTLEQMRFGYLRMACTGCDRTLALYTWRRGELCLTWHYTEGAA